MKDPVVAVDEIIAELRAEQQIHKQKIERIDNDIRALSRAREVLAARVPAEPILGEKSPHSRPTAPTAFEVVPNQFTVFTVPPLPDTPKRTRHTKIEKAVFAAMREAGKPLTVHLLTQTADVSTERMVRYLTTAVKRGVLVVKAGRYSLAGEPT